MNEHTLGKPRTAGVSPSISTVVLTVLVVWLAAALAVAASGLLEDAPTPLPVILIWTPVLGFLVVFARSRSFREWVLGLNLRWPILFHVVRAGIGAGFLLMSGRELPAEFAVPGGIGDIIVGTSAPVVALYFVPASTALRRRVVFGWNAVGLLDMLMVFATAQRILFFGDDPDAMVELTRFPLLVVPMFVVPMVLITHFIVFARLWRMRGR